MKAGDLFNLNFDLLYLFEADHAYAIELIPRINVVILSTILIYLLIVFIRIFVPSKPVEFFLKEDEKIIYKDEPHMYNFVMSIVLISIPIFVFLGLYIFALATEEYKGQSMYLAFVLIPYLIFFLAARAILVYYLTASAVITNSRILIKKGLIGASTSSNQLTKIEKVEVSQGIIGRIFDISSLTVRGIGGGEHDYIYILPLKNSNKFYQKLQKAVDNAMPTLDDTSQKI